MLMKRQLFLAGISLIALAILYRVSPMELLVEEDLVPSSSHIWGNAA